MERPFGSKRPWMLHTADQTMSLRACGQSNWQVMLADAKALKRAHPHHVVRDLFSGEDGGQIPVKSWRDECPRKEGTET